MKYCLSLGLVAVAALLGSARLAVAAGTEAAGTLSASTAATGPTVPAIPTTVPTVAAVHPAMAEVFHPAPVPDESDGGPMRRVAETDAGPNLHPDFLGVHEKVDGPLGDTDLAYSRNERMKPAGGMSLDIPMQ